jgi:hypothetical protein
VALQDTITAACKAARPPHSRASTSANLRHGGVKQMWLCGTTVERRSGRDQGAHGPTGGRRSPLKGARGININTS